MSKLHNMADCVSRDTSPDTSPDTAVKHDGVTTYSLELLQGKDQRTIMDTVDRLRRIGLSGIVSLPQVVVCGDQSSGKSSVLDAITEIPFPRKENLCTRFATEIILRRGPTESIDITITPDKGRGEKEKVRINQFRRTLEDFSQLPTIIEDATKVMGLGYVGENNSRAFSRDVLSVDICGPDRPQLTLVDLPGLIHATNKAQTEADKVLILDLVKEYMKNPRTIILAVVSAKNDFANQVILEHCKELDPKSERTLGIITKPDYLRERSQNQQAWIDLAQNKDIYFKLGWHMLRNRADNEMENTFAERNMAENLFFLTGAYQDLPRQSVGIGPLRDRLSQLLTGHLRKELPTLREEMATKLQDTLAEIQKLGEKRATIPEQRMMLINISMEFSSVLKCAIDGLYNNSFFGHVHLSDPVDSAANMRRFRAVVQHLNLQFATDIRLRGQKYIFGGSPGDDDVEKAEEKKDLEDLKTLLDDGLLPKPKVLGRPQAISWVQKILERTRGSELPGSFNPMIIGHLFQEQSSPWEQIGVEHINTVFAACKRFVRLALEHTAPVELLDRLTDLCIDGALSKALQESKEELGKIIADKSTDPMTYNHYFISNIQKNRKRKRDRIRDRAFEGAMPMPPVPMPTPPNVSVFGGGYQPQQTHQLFTGFDPARVKKMLAESEEQDMDKFSAEEALDSQRAYYKDEMKFFINAVTKHVIERHLVRPLPNIFTALVVTNLTDDEVQYIAEEPEELTHQREFLSSRLEILRKGLDTFNEAMGSLKRKR